jgi:hypothetical protein
MTSLTTDLSDRQNRCPDALGQVWANRFRGWAESLFPLLDAAGLPGRLHGQRCVLLKPNLVETSPPPITTPVALLDALLGYLRVRCPCGRPGGC